MCVGACLFGRQFKLGFKGHQQGHRHVSRILTRGECEARLSSSFHGPRDKASQGSKGLESGPAAFAEQAREPGLGEAADVTVPCSGSDVAGYRGFGELSGGVLQAESDREGSQLVGGSGLDWWT